MANKTVSQDETSNFDSSEVARAFLNTKLAKQCDGVRKVVNMLNVDGQRCIYQRPEPIRIFYISARKRLFETSAFL